MTLNTLLRLACFIKTRILDFIWPCLLIIMIMTWLFSGILFICALVLVFENRIPTERNKIKHKTPSTHCGPIFSLRAGWLVWVVYHGQRQQGTENRRTLAPFFSPAPLPAIPYLKIPYPNKWACSQANLFLKCAIIAFLWFVKKPWLCKNKKQKH